MYDIKLDTFCLDWSQLSLIPYKFICIRKVTQKTNLMLNCPTCLCKIKSRPWLLWRADITGWEMNLGIDMIFVITSWCLINKCSGTVFWDSREEIILARYWVGHSLVHPLSYTFRYNKIDIFWLNWWTGSFTFLWPLETFAFRISPSMSQSTFSYS